jgi:hypothetical protein
MKVARQGRTAIFTLVQDGVEKELGRLECPAAEVRSASVYCTRLKKGNARAEFLLKKLSVEAEGFYSYQAPKSNRLTWSRILLLVSGCFFVLTTYVYLRRRPRRV